MIKLTKDNYHTFENTAISNSKANTFLLSKELYYMKYVTGEWLHETTPAMFLGKIVDETIEKGSKWFTGTYTVKVLKKDDADEFERQKTMDKNLILTQDIYTKVIRMTEKIMKAPFFQEYKGNVNAEFQAPLEATVDGIDICGLADIITFSKDTIYIDDLKTSQASSMRDAQKWAWHCDSMGYLRQMAVYGAIAKEMYPEFENIVYRHFVISSDKSKNFPLKLFILPNEMVDPKFEEFMEIARDIKNEEDWIDKLPAWSDAEILPREEDELSPLEDM